LNARIIGIRILTIKEIAAICGEPVVPMLERQELLSDAFTLASVIKSQRETFEELVEIVRLAKSKQLMRLKPVDWATQERVAVPLPAARRKMVLARQG
jgi:hypothetical protein